MPWLSDCLLHENERTAMFWSTDSELALQMCCIGDAAMGGRLAADSPMKTEERSNGVP